MDDSGSSAPEVGATEGTALVSLSAVGICSRPPDLSGIVSECAQPDSEHGDDQSGKYPL